MKTELNEQDRERIEHEAKLYAKNHSSAPDKETPDWIITDFCSGAEYEHNYQREQQEKFQAVTPDDLDLMNLIKKLKVEIALMNGTILDKGIQIKQLEAERSELNGKVARLEAAVWMLLHHIPDTPDMEPIREKCKTELNSLKTK